MKKDKEVDGDGWTADTAVAASSKESKKELVIQPLAVDFSREDLNTLVSKVNEVIEWVNNK